MIWHALIAKPEFVRAVQAERRRQIEKGYDAAGSTAPCPVCNRTGPSPQYDIDRNAVHHPTRAPTEPARIAAEAEATHDAAELATYSSGS